MRVLPSLVATAGAVGVALASTPAFASLDGVASTHELKAAVVISAPCGDKPPFAAKTCSVEVMYFQTEPLMGPMKLRSFLRCTRVSWNGEVVEHCDYPQRPK